MMRWGRAVSLGTRNGCNASRRRNNGLLGAASSPAAGARGVYYYADVAGPSATMAVVRHFSVDTPAPPVRGRLSLPKQAPFIQTVLGCQQQQEQQQQAQQQQQHGGAEEGAEEGLREGFREAMMKERRPLQFLGVDTAITAGSMCGHTSLGILAFCYLETDALTLRELVICGSSLNLFFSYYRSQPLWISIKWNALFLAINATLIALMWKESADAEDFVKDPELERIFRDIFMPVDLTPLEFMQLMEMAQRRVMLKGNDLNQEGRPHEEMFLIVEGTADVKSEGEAVCRLESGGFVGSMAFNRFIQESPPGRRATAASSYSHHRSAAAAAAVPASFRGEDSSGDDQPGVSYDCDSSSASGGFEYGGGRGILGSAREAFLNLLRGDSVVGKVAMSLVPDVVDGPQDLDRVERSTYTVTATSDAVVYAWNQHDLRAFIKRRRLIGCGLQKAISEDFVNKVDQSRGHKKRYRLLLEEALDGGSINLTEKKKLYRYRRLHDISLEEHKDLLEGRGWTEEDFEAGFQPGVAPRQGSKNFAEYEELVRRELSDGEVKSEAKLFLLNFRKQGGIDAQEHILALEKQGWTADDYEVGVKDISAADFGKDLKNSHGFSGSSHDSSSSSFKAQGNDGAAPITAVDTTLPSEESNGRRSGKPRDNNNVDTMLAEERDALGSIARKEDEKDKNQGEQEVHRATVAARKPVDPRHSSEGLQRHGMGQKVYA